MNFSELRRDIGSLLWIGFEGTELNADLKNILVKGDAGGVTLFARNIPRKAEGELVDLEALKKLNDAIHQSVGAPEQKVFISVDQEGGRVQRIQAPLEHYPSMYSQFALLSDDEAGTSAKALGFRMGTEVHQLGFDIDFAPVLDVHTNAENPIIGDRAFSSNPAGAALRALAFAEGLKEAGILSCAKHFPGHGDTFTDSHLQLPRIDHSMEHLWKSELLPFAEAVRAQIPMFMTAHVVFSALDDSVPATLSSRVVTGLLREEMGYKGVIVSDDLDMKAIVANFGIAEAAVQSIVAGCNVLLLCRNREHQEKAREALHHEAVSSAEFRKKIQVSAGLVRELQNI